MDLGFAWWWRLLDPEHGSVFRATATRPAFADAPGLAFEPQLATGAWERTVWSQDDPEYQPYLRLT
jgi:hypothetical protein